MFREAIRKIGPLTQPVILSRATVEGKCSSSIAAFVIINEGGWIITAGHVVMHYNHMLEQVEIYNAIKRKKASILADGSLTDDEKKRDVSSLPSLTKDHTIGCSAWWGADGIQIVDMAALPIVDLGIGRIEPFNPGWFSTYPVFKKPEENFLAGVSLCKLGFPFHRIETTWNSENMVFEIPAEALPLPHFPIEGILTRQVNIIIDDPQPKYPLQWIETSSPGLKGQSGGPIFDTNGTVWGVQSHTQSYPLGFDPLVPGDTSGRKEHQFLNVGRGVHTATIIGALKDLKIAFRMSES